LLAIQLNLDVGIRTPARRRAGIVDARVSFWLLAAHIFRIR
jgi:hypothetical protein